MQLNELKKIIKKEIEKRILLNERISDKNIIVLRKRLKEKSASEPDLKYYKSQMIKIGNSLKSEFGDNEDSKKAFSLHLAAIIYKDFNKLLEIAKNKNVDEFKDEIDDRVFWYKTKIIGTSIANLASWFIPGGFLVKLVAGLFLGSGVSMLSGIDTGWFGEAAISKVNDLDDSSIDLISILSFLIMIDPVIKTSNQLNDKIYSLIPKLKPEGLNSEEEETKKEKPEQRLSKDNKEDEINDDELEGFTFIS